jgi:DNA-binding NtrC family response regulator
MCDFDVTMAARSDACVLFTGGRVAVEAAARRIHELSAWGNGPFELVRCEWPEAVWDALTARVFTEADPFGQAGTLLLQDVWRVGPVLQSRLADALGRLRGDLRSRFRQWRLMASTTRPLLPLVADGTFDDRLFYRLNVMHLVLPDGDTGEVEEQRVPRRAQR